MTLEEYGAWFTGFSETMPSPPGIGYWNVIKERVCEVDGLRTTLTLYHARYWRHSPPVEEGSFSILPAMEALGKFEAAQVSASLAA